MSISHPAGAQESPVSLPDQRSAFAPFPGSGSADIGTRSLRWQHRFATVVAVGDVAVIAITVSLAIVFGLHGREEAADRAHLVSGLLAGVLLVLALPAFRAWEARRLGTGPTEFLRIGRASLGAAVLLGMGGLALMVDSVRIWVFLLIPLTGALCLVSRFVLRKWLHRQRVKGRCSQPVLAVGSEEAVADLVRRTRRDPYFGWHVTAACTPTGTASGANTDVDGVPVVGDLDSISLQVHERGFCVVAVCHSPGWGARRLHRLAWDLEDTDAELAVDPGLMEIAGPRMHIAPVDGLPLLRLSRPRFTGWTRLIKGALDRATATLLLLGTFPLFVGLALAIKFTDGGPVFFRQERVGVNGRTFRMIKFRSMCVDAEARREELDAFNEGSGPMFKIGLDPRVTRIGATLRRYSLDELPQLLNVLGGSMSLVGPRPPLPHEVTSYADDARRRLLVRPGMTGLWQVSGRSSLSWEESVRLDLRYVENWSLAMDLIILWKTFGAVRKGRGAC